MLLFILAEHPKAVIEDIMGHVDVENPHSFEEADFVQLIAKVFCVYVGHSYDWLQLAENFWEDNNCLT